MECNKYSGLPKPIIDRIWKDIILRDIDLFKKRFEAKFTNQNLILTSKDL